MSVLPKILLAEDSLRDAELIVQALSRSNVVNEVVHVRDGVEALDYLYRRGTFAHRNGDPPAVVLLDLKMPRMDGLDVLRQIKTDPDLRQIPVVVMTSSREEGDLLRSYELGVNAYVVKPLRFGDFVQAVQRTGAFWALTNEHSPARQSGPKARAGTPDAGPGSAA